MAIIDTPSTYFQTTVYTGNASNNHAITNSGPSNLAPNWVWIKNRGTGDNRLFDSVRGVNKIFTSNNTSASDGNYSSTLTAFGSNGFTLANDSDGFNVNANSNPYVSWNWAAGTSFTNDASGTGIGTIDSAGSVNQDAGFSICSFTGTGSNGTVKHGLNSAPSTIIYKRSNSSGGWVVWHKSIGTNILELNGTGAQQSGSSYINGTVPTSSVFSIGTSGDINANGGTYIAYCFAGKQSYSKFKSYKGNGSANGPFSYTGFKPAYILLKESSSTGSWCIFDSKRLGFNQSNPRLYANNTGGEDSSEEIFDILSNGFKIRGTQSDTNASGQTYIYMAFAENPFVTSTGDGSIPTTAR